jgi:hypothetical protein
MSSPINDLPASLPGSSSSCPDLPSTHQSPESCDSSVYSSNASSCSSSSRKRVHFETHVECAYISDSPSSSSSQHPAQLQRRSSLWKLVSSSRTQSYEDVAEQQHKDNNKPAKLVRRRNASTLHSPTQRRSSWAELMEQGPSLPVPVPMPPVETTVVVQPRPRTNFYIVKQPLQDIPGKRLARSSLHTDPNARSPLFSGSGVTQSSKGAWDDLLT